MSRRAQAALEFLMTYGWAILIMLVVISVLFFLGVFTPQASITKSCVLPAGFTCYDYDIDANGNIYLDVGQATGKTVTITGLGCSASTPSVTLNPNVQIPTGSHAVVTIGGTNCSGAAGSAFKGKLLIQYTVSGSSGTRSITGDISAPLIGNSSSWGGGSYGGSGSFLYRRQVTVNTNVSSDLTDFPAYFTLNTNSLISAGKMNNSCKDLRVLDSTMSTLLDYEIENNTCNTTSTVVWFRIPQTRANITSLAYVFYGNNSTSDAQNTAGVWRNGYVAVYHLGDATDSVGANNGANNGSSFSSGRFGNAISFDGATNCISFGTSPPTSFVDTDNFTLAFCAKPVSLKTGSYYGLRNSLVYKGDGSASRADYFMQIENASYVSFGKRNSTQGLVYYTFSASVTVGSWSCWALTHKSTNVIELFQDGASLGMQSTYKLESDSAFNLELARAGYLSDSNIPLNGSMDEFRISSVARSADWVKAEYGQTYSVGSEQVN